MSSSLVLAPRPAPTVKRTHKDSVPREEVKTVEQVERSISFQDYINQVSPKYRWYKHCKKLTSVLQRVADGELKRVMIFMPPRHGKTETASRLFGSYFLYRYPWRWVSINSYGASLADTLSNSARDFYKTAGGKCRGDSNSKKHWETLEGGGMFAAGVGGPITGKGWHLGVIDDPLKNAEESLSETIRKKQKDWYSSTFYTREEPWSETESDGALIVILTRWNEGDLAGWLLEQEKSDDKDDHERWHIVCMEAIKSAEPFDVPDTCTLEPDDRAIGEALCPERRPLEKLKRIAKKIGPYFWGALFQQRPFPLEGDLIKLAWFRRYETLPEPRMIVLSYDTANKPGKLKAFSVRGVWFVCDNGYYLVDVWRDRVEMPVLKQQIINDCDRWNPHAVLIEDKASGTGVIQLLWAERNFPIIPIEPESDKLTRLMVESPTINAGNVWLPKDDRQAHWLPAYEKELISVPNGAYMDQCDMTSQFLNYMRSQYTQFEFSSSGAKRTADTIDDYLRHG